MKSIKIMLVLFSIITANQNIAQTPNIENILPTKDVNQSISKIRYSVMGIGSTVHVDIHCDINNYNKCAQDNFFGRLDVDLNWYNTNDETGKFMLNMMKDMQAFTQEMADFKISSGFEKIGEAKEVSMEGGKYWIFAEQKPCVNEITGPTGETQHFSQIRCYVFDGIKTIKFDLFGYFTSDKAKEIMLETVQNIKKFDFSTLATVMETK